VSGAGIRFGVTAASITQDDGGVDVSFTDGASGRYDMMIAADGVRSATRRALGLQLDTRPTGMGIWRLVCTRPESIQWTVFKELSMDLSLDGVGDLDSPVLATAHALGPLGSTSLGICTLSYRGMVIGGGTVRSFFIDADDIVPQYRSETLRRSAETTFADLMAAHVVNSGAAPVLAQRVDRNLNNDIDIVHGGVAAAGLELAASAAINRGHSDDLLQTASVRVNFLRPFLAGADSRYEGTPLRLGRNTAVGDAQAIGDDGKAAITARVTAYR
jgi:uncharacterized protein (TIGR00369 family)